MTAMKEWQILVVEDEPDGQDVVAGLLAYFGIDCDRAMNAEDALVRLGQRSYTAIVVDLMLPGMDGLEFVRQIRRQPEFANLPCVAITAYHSSLVRQQVMQAGFNAYVPKPLGDTSFVHELERVIEAR